MKALRIIVLLLISGFLMSIITFWVMRSGYSPHLANTELFGYPTDVKVSYGDNPRWSDPGFDDSQWTRNIEDRDTIFWVRCRITLPSVQREFDTRAVRIEFLASYELYWDGNMIGRNGRPALETKDEDEGRLNQIFAIPDSLAGAGEHHMAFRASNHYADGRIRFFTAEAGDYFDLSTHPIIFTSFMYVLAGLFAIVFIYYTFIYFNSYRHAQFLLFAVLCLLFFLLIFFEYLKFHYLYPYSCHYPRLEFIQLLTQAFGVVMVSFFAVRFEVPRKWIFIMLSLIAIVFTPYSLDFFFRRGFDYRAYITALVSFSISTLIIVWAVYKKKTGATELLVGILPCFLVTIYFDFVLYLGFVNLTIYNLISFSNQLRIQKDQQREAEIRSIQLEAQLLRKNIQPHFIMNTLTSLMEWIELDPGRSTKFIENLAAEFRLLNEVSSKKLIEVAQEIELCRSHLEVMNYRKGINYQLQCFDLNLSEQIPPATFHTVIENGITHNRQSGTEAVFKIAQISEGPFRTYRIESPGEFEQATAQKEGTGVKYIKARLEESFPSKWDFKTEAGENCWITTIKIKK